VKVKRILISTFAIFMFFAFCQPVLGEDIDDGYSIVINIPRYSITLFRGVNEVKTYPIAVGKPYTATPVGNYYILNRLMYPTWHPNSKDPVPPGPDNPLGIRWMGFYRGYGIHGNNKPESIGKAVSGGCIRMFNYDADELYSMVDIGVPVQVKYEGLIETKGEEAVISYCDIYGRQKDYRNMIEEELEKTGILNKIPAKKLENLFSALMKKPVVFSDKWAFMVNGEFLTADTIYDRTMIFINAEKLNDFFGISIEWDGFNNTGKLMGRPISAYKIGEKVYASIADVAAILGGCLTASVDIQELNYHINFIKVDGRFVTSDVAHFKTHPEVDISLINSEKKGLIRIEQLEEEGYGYNIFSKKGYIELMSTKSEGF